VTTETNAQTHYDNAKKAAEQGKGMPDSRGMTSHQREAAEAGYAAGKR
jgi:Na+/H+-translocating membrane pyrophosphatase